MYKGKKQLKILKDQAVDIRATAPFHVVEFADGAPLRVLGPNSSEDRRWKNHFREPCVIEVVTDEEALWSYHLKTFPRSEHPDPTPVEIPLDMTRPESIEEMMARMINARFSVMAEAAGFETEEEANDFDTGEPDEWSSPYELQDMQADSPFYEEAQDDRKKQLDSEAPAVDNENQQGTETEGTDQPSPG